MNHTAKQSPEFKLACRLADSIREYVDFCEEHARMSRPAWDEALTASQKIEDLTTDQIYADFKLHIESAYKISEARPSMGRHSSARYDKLQSAIRNICNRIQNFLDYGVTVDILAD